MKFFFPFIHKIKKNKEPEPLLLEIEIPPQKIKEEEIKEPDSIIIIDL